MSSSSRPMSTADFAAAAPPGQDIEHQVRAAQVALVFNRACASNRMAPAVGLLVCWLLWSSVDRARLVGWCGLLVAAVLWREIIYRRFLADTVENSEKWGQRHDYALFGAGAVYGLIGTLILPRDEPATAAVLLAALIAIASVGMVVLATKLRATLAFSVPVLLPTIVAELAQGTRLSIFAGLGMLIFLALIAAEGRHASEHTMEMLRVRFRMDELAAQRQQALDQAQRSSAVKSQFLATMSHEMHTPLHGILGVTRLLRSASADADPRAREQQLLMIERTGEHLLGLINDVLDYSKIEEGHLRIEAADFDLAALVESVADLARVSATEKGLAATLAFEPPAPCWVRADASRLRQVLLNLMGNAVKFTEHGGVTLAVRRRADGHTVFEVIDTGPGIAPDQRELIFEAFQQADGSFGRRHGGTGLGLSISRELAHALGGRLACVGAAQGGACFVLDVPLPRGEPATPPPERPAAPSALRGRVLVAEDNAVNALVTEALLARIGLRVDLVVDGAQAVARTADVRYDLILMDCQMPGMDGFEATRQIRARERNAGAAAVPIVALTANALDSDRRRSIAAGMNEHLAKPFREHELGLLLQRYLG